MQHHHRISPKNGLCHYVVKITVYLKRALTLVAMVAATNCSFEIEIDFKGARLDLLIIKLQNIGPF